MNNNGTVCGQCGASITDETPTGDPTKRKPCPQCGSTSRKFNISGTSQVSFSASLRLEIITYPFKLLSDARDLIDNGKFNIAVVVLHMACEIATERVLSEAFKQKGLQFLEESIAEFLNGYNLSNIRLRKLYTTLTGDKIANQPFWQNFTKSAVLRNKIVHKGLIVGKTEAEESFKAIRDLLKHLNK